MADWHVWHEQYADPGSSLSRRLKVVQQLLVGLVAELRPPQRILSLCAGDGRDVIPVLAEIPPERRPELTLVELDPDLASAARRRAAEADVPATVVVGDAGLSSTWGDQLPADLLMLCGIFGNVSDADIRTTILSVPAMLTPSGAVIWTRGTFGGRDLQAQVRQWFDDAGFVEIAFESEPAGYGVGANRITPQVAIRSMPGQLFAFNR